MSDARTRQKVVIDTNLFVSGIITNQGYPCELLEAWRQHRFLLLIAKEQSEELTDVLTRDYFVKRYQLKLDIVAALFRRIDATARKVSLVRHLPFPLRDPKDEPILAAALGGKADYLVTGGDDLLAERHNPKLGNLQIVTAVEFMKILHP